MGGGFGDYNYIIANSDSEILEISGYHDVDLSKL